jgi:hypothetical protein
MNHWLVVGYLVPSNAGKSYRVVIDSRTVGLVAKEALLRSLQARPMLIVEISKFVDQPSETPKHQSTLKVADPEKLKSPEETLQHG